MPYDYESGWMLNNLDKDVINTTSVYWEVTVNQLDFHANVSKI